MGLRMRLALFQPDIPQNLGAAMRLCACLGAPLEVIEPCGFPLSDKALRRAAMDYGAACELVRRASWEAFAAAAERTQGRLVLFTTRGAGPLHDFVFQPGDTLLFGRESAGVPSEVHRGRPGPAHDSAPGGRPVAERRDGGRDRASRSPPADGRDAGVQPRAVSFEGGAPVAPPDSRIRKRRSGPMRLTAATPALRARLKTGSRSA